MTQRWISPVRSRSADSARGSRRFHSSRRSWVLGASRNGGNPRRRRRRRRSACEERFTSATPARIASSSIALRVGVEELVPQVALDHVRSLRDDAELDFPRMNIGATTAMIAIPVVVIASALACALGRVHADALSPAALSRRPDRGGRVGGVRARLGPAVQMTAEYGLAAARTASDASSGSIPRPKARAGIERCRGMPAASSRRADGGVSVSVCVAFPWSFFHIEGCSIGTEPVWCA